MIVNLETKKLKVGMFIDLSASWMANPFWKSKFKITFEKEIEKILKAGIKNVNVDTDKSKVNTEIPREKKVNTSKKKKDTFCPNASKIDLLNKSRIENKTNIATQKNQERIDKKNIKVIDKKTPEKIDSDDSSAPSEWNPEKFIPKEIVEAFRDKSLPPDERAKVVQSYSIEMMKNLLDNPTAEVISGSKKSISEIVDVILHEDDTARGLVKLVSHDFYTYTHSVNVGMKAVILAKRLYKSSDKHDMDELGAGFFLHDIGKVTIDADIINKPGKFTEEEREMMRTHPYQGYKVLSETKQLTEEAWVIVMQHHERDDGKGYPRKLKGEDIHPYARICCIADVYDALTAKRSYKKDKKPIEALKIMYEEMATHFNKKLLEKFISLFK